MRKVAWIIAGVVLALPSLTSADGIADKAAACSACHGENGVPGDVSIPVLNGQNEGYIYLQLRDYKRSDRNSDVMQAVTAELDNKDMQDLAAHFAKLPWPNLEQPRASQEVAHQAEVVMGSAGCAGCHLDGYVGNSTSPRLAGQRKEYLASTMRAFRSNERTNNSWMTALLQTYNESDIDALATVLAGL
jgi:cytochrome c553